MKRMLVILAGLLVVGIFAGQALAADPTTGWIQVCKTSAAAPNAVNGMFRFRIHPSAGADVYVDVQVGLCSSPVQVAAGTTGVTELGAYNAMHANGTTTGTPDGSADYTAFLSTTATGTGASGATGSYNSATRTYTVTVPPSADQSQAVTVTFTNALDPGVVEICKQVVPGSNLTGTWTFTVTGSNGFTATTSPVPIGDCSPAITVPAGFVKVQETGDNAENVTAITGVKTASATDAVVGPNASAPKFDLPTATVVVSVDPGDASKQTLVTFTNNSVRLKLCKIWDGGGVADPQGTTGYPFAFTYSGPAGPNSGPASLNLPAGTEASPNCILVGTSYRAGTRVTLTEGIVPGTKVDSLGDASPGISVNPAGNAVPGTTFAENRTTTVTLGAGETVVTFEDIPALRGTLKICKASTSTPPLIPPGTLFSFTVAPVAPTTGVTQTVMVPSGSCGVVGNFPFDSTWTVTEAPAPNVTVTAINSVPATVVVLENGVATNTNQAVLTNINLGARSTNVTIGENNITEVTFTNQDPPSGDSGGGSTGGVGGSTGGGSTGGSSSGGSSGGGSSAGAGSAGNSATSEGGSSTSAAANVVPLTPPAIVGIGLGTSSGSKSSATASELQKAATLSKLQKQLSANKATLKKLVEAKAAAKTLARKHALAKRIAALRALDVKLVKEIKQLS